MSINRVNLPSSIDPSDKENMPENGGNKNSSRSNSLFPVLRKRASVGSLIERASLERSSHFPRRASYTSQVEKKEPSKLSLSADTSIEKGRTASKIKGLFPNRRTLSSRALERRSSMPSHFPKGYHALSSKKKEAWSTPSLTRSLPKKNRKNEIANAKSSKASSPVVDRRTLFPSIPRQFQQEDWAKRIIETRNGKEKGSPAASKHISYENQSGSLSSSNVAKKQAKLPKRDPSKLIPDIKKTYKQHIENFHTPRGRNFNLSDQSERFINFLSAFSVHEERCSSLYFTVIAQKDSGTVTNKVSVNTKLQQLGFSSLASINRTLSEKYMDSHISLSQRDIAAIRKIFKENQKELKAEMELIKELVKEDDEEEKSPPSSNKINNLKSVLSYDEIEKLGKFLDSFKDIFETGLKVGKKKKR